MRRLVHPTTKTRGAEAPTGTREGHQSRHAAILARKVCEASLQDATVEVAGKLGAHEFRQSTVPSLFDSGIERGQVFPHHLVQRLSERVVLDAWPPPHSVDVGQRPSAMRAACHCLLLSVAGWRCCLSP